MRVARSGGPPHARSDSEHGGGAQRQDPHQGFTLIELLVTLGVLALLFLTITSIATALLRTTNDLRFQTTATALANERIEVARTLPYADVGTTTGIPRGKLIAQDAIVRDGLSMAVTTTIRNTDDPFDGTIGGTPNDTAPADYKKIEITILCTSCQTATNPVILTTFIAPKNLELSSGNGALFIHVLDALGANVAGANVHIENQKLSPNLTIDDVTDTKGMLQLVDIPPSTGGYNIRVSKQGYSTDATYPSGGSDNPNPKKTDSTVLKETVTEANFFIDRVSTLTVRTLNDRCVLIPSVAGTITGTKQVGENPDKPKYTGTFTTNGSGTTAIGNLEWDTYTLALSGTQYTEAGSIPQNPITIAPGVTQGLDLILNTYAARNLLVSVQDGVTGLPLPEATVTLTKGSSTQTRETGRGFIVQTDWSGGAEQEVWQDETRYAADSGTLDTTSSAGNVLLKKQNKVYATDGALESSTIDFGNTPEYVAIRVTPGDQPAAAGQASVRLQIATNNDAATWNFVGPDGTVNTFFTNTVTDIPNLHNGRKYLRYRLLLHTDDVAVSPNVSEVQIIFVSECTPPGQAFFRALSDGQYTMSVAKPGYATIEEDIQIDGNVKKNVTIAP